MDVVPSSVANSRCLVGRDENHFHMRDLIIGDGLRRSPLVSLVSIIPSNENCLIFCVVPNVRL